MRCHERVEPEAEVRMDAGPRVFFRPGDHPRTHGMALDVTINGQHISIRTDEARFKTTFSRRSGAPVALIEHLDIALRRPAQRLRSRTRTCRTALRVNVVAHQDIRMNGDTALPREKPEQAQVVLPVFVIHEDGAAVDAGCVT